jgi:hypothetical protein
MLAEFITCLFDTGSTAKEEPGKWHLYHAEWITVPGKPACQRPVNDVEKYLQECKYGFLQWC